MTTKTARNATSVRITDELASRWSPRGFDADYALTREEVRALGEAARWAPSAANTQPTHFIVAVRGTETFDRIHEHLLDFNKAWTPRASALLVAVAETSRDGKPLRWAEYDLGQAVAHLSIEAEARGLNVRQMGGIDVEGIRKAFDLAENFVPVTAIAIGRYDASEAVPAETRERDTAARGRRSIEEISLVLDLGDLGDLETE